MRGGEPVALVQMNLPLAIVMKDVVDPPAGVHWCDLRSFSARVLRVRPDVWQAAFGDRALPTGASMDAFSANDLYLGTR